MFDAVKEFAARHRPGPAAGSPPAPAPAPAPAQNAAAAEVAARPAAATVSIAGPTAADDAKHMARALALAAKGINSTHPNPRVGCVVVAGGAVVGEGWHRAAGGEHAEIAALRQAGKRAAGATLYSNLEPCSHHGRTPPCADAVIAAGIGRAVIAMYDPNPRVDGVGALRRAGVEVTVGVGARAAAQLNRGFCARFSIGRPWVTLKMAASLDGKTALADGRSQWITGQAARRDAHRLRAASSAILTGIGTVLRDDPRLTVRLGARRDGKLATGRQPLRVILDSHLSTPPRAKILRAPGNALLITTAAEAAAIGLLRGPGVEVLVCRAAGRRIDLAQVMRELAAREVNDLLVEAGPQLSGELLRQGLVDQVVVYLAPDLLGGGGAREMFDLPGLESLDDRHRLQFADLRRLGRDLRLTLDVAGRDSVGAAGAAGAAGAKAVADPAQPPRN